ncbi:hypothetical protein QBC39DRAFT_27865 [Podospora conica]|nr:hypothetical protein QBC39DRAFT_27865 [Schizothecium conicum]
MSLSMMLDIEPADTPGAAEPRLTRGDRDQPMDDYDDSRANVELAFIMTAASNPVSPGPSSPPLNQTHIQDFVPPTRPSSTPFPQPEPRSTELRLASDPYEMLMDLDTADPADLPSSAPLASQRGVSLNDLPAEIHECILDHLFGYRVSPQSKSSIVRWGTALRHPRRKELSEFALVSGTWRVLIQERLYRHIKLKATLDSMRQAIVYFADHPHLRSYIRHIEIWFPVFQPRYGPLALTTLSTLPTVTADGLTNASYILPADNCSLEEAFYFVAETFPEACILTLEGGERKKAPKVRHRIRHQEGEQSRPMPKVETIRTLVCKGQWNLIRTGSDFDSIMSALPNLREWHANYTKPKSKSYINMAEILGKPLHLTTLDLCIEADYRRETSCPAFFRKVWEKAHLCPKLAQAVASPSMERVSYTGRICRQFFQDLVAKQADPRQTRLKSIDLTVKNFCRHGAQFEMGSGITDMDFIAAFEAFVIKGIRALNRLQNVDYLRIRYVDLDSPIPPLNPYFTMENGVCSGVWSDDILTELARARPAVQFEELADTLGALTTTKDGRVTIAADFPKSRIKSIKMSTYSLLQPNLAANVAPTIF